MEISIFGLGYVGLISGTCFAEQDHRVIGVDIDEQKIQSLNDGNAYVEEPGLHERLRQVSAEGRFTATEDAEQALAETDVSMICVGTPSTADGGQDLRAVRNVMENIGNTLTGTGDSHVVILRSTVLPGTSQELLQTLREKCGCTIPGDLQYVYHPEFLREGNAISDFYDPPFTVYGTDQEQGDAELFDALYPDVKSELFHVQLKEAEMLKYVCNAFHALKVGFANEIGRLSREMRIDGRQVMDLICRDHKLNISEKYLAPGFAFGGSCLPKDVRALADRAEQQSVSLPLINNILSSNEEHLGHAEDLVMEAHPEKIGMLGIRFKASTDDVRESPMLKLGMRLRKHGVEICCHDSVLDLNTIHGTNRRFLQKMLQNPEENMADSIEELLQFSSTVLIGVDDDRYREILLEHRQQPLKVYDFVGLFEGEDCPDPWTYHGICW